MTTVNATGTLDLQAEQADESKVALLADAARALTVADATARTALAAIQAAIEGTLTIAGAVTTDVDVSSLATEAKLEQVRALLAGTLTVDTGLAQPIEDGGTVAVSNFPATQPVSTAQPTTETPATGTITASGDTTVVAAPGAGNRIVVYYYTWVPDPDSTNTPMVTLKASGGTAYHLAPATAKTWTHTLPENEALVLSLSQTASGDGVGYTIFYGTEAV